MKRPSASDYAWFNDRYGDVESYCFTLVADIRPAEVLAVLGIKPQLHVEGIDGLRRPSQDEIIKSDRMLAGFTAVGDWTLMVEIGGFLGAMDHAMRPVSVSRTVVSNQRGIAGESYFSWWHDGNLRLRFDHAFADAREGTHPDEILTDIQESGYETSGEDYPGELIERQFAAGFALSERITGVQLTPALLSSAEFIGGPAQWQPY